MAGSLGLSPRSTGCGFTRLEAGLGEYMTELGCLGAVKLRTMQRFEDGQAGPVLHHLMEIARATIDLRQLRCDVAGRVASLVVLLVVPLVVVREILGGMVESSRKSG